MTRTPRRTAAAAAALLALVALVALVAGCQADSAESEAGSSASGTGTPSASGGTLDATSATPSATPTPARAVAAPRNRACYAYRYPAAIAPVTQGDPVPCAKHHTAITFSVGRLDTVIDGHLVSVDSDRVRAQIASECPRAFVVFVGGTPEIQRLSMLRPVWFTPSVKESDAGANWYRCDVVALAADEELAPLTGRLKGVLARPLAREQYAMCGTAEPGTAAFHRVICSAAHSWRAIATVDVPGKRYPGVDVAREAGQDRCRDAGLEVADDALNYRWGYEWPTAQQWRAGQHWGICWAPD